MIKAVYLFVIITLTQAVRLADLVARNPTGLIGSQIGDQMGEYVPNTSTNAPITSKPVQAVQELKRKQKV
jgi:hypothetical protein